MTHTLYCGERRLGVLHALPLESPSPHVRAMRRAAHMAVLVPAEAVLLNGVWQVTFQVHGRVIVHQDPITPDVLAERERGPSPSQSRRSHVALTPMTAEEAVGVAPDQQLTVRDTSGRVSLPAQIRLQEVRYGPEHLDALQQQVPRAALREGSCWWVFIADADDAASFLDTR